MINPPVHDSATATVCRRFISSAPTRFSSEGVSDNVASHFIANYGSPARIRPDQIAICVILQSADCGNINLYIEADRRGISGDFGGAPS
jgi:hypothetical protein